MAQFSIVIIVSPMEESFCACHIHLDSQDSVPGGSRGQQSVGKSSRCLQSRVINPELIAIFHNFIHFLGSMYHDGHLHIPLFIEFIMRKGISAPEPPDLRPDSLHRFGIIGKMLLHRLVRDMEQNISLIDMIFFQKRFQAAQIRLQEITVFPAGRIRIPAKYLPLRSVYCGNDFRRMPCSPLGVQMAVFEMGNTTFPAHFHIALHQRKVKTIFIICLRHAH